MKNKTNKVLLNVGTDLIESKNDTMNEQVAAATNAIIELATWVCSAQKYARNLELMPEAAQYSGL